MPSNIMENWARKVKALRTEAYALYLASRDPRVPWYAKLFAGCVAGYLFSPIDLIPDFIPVLGYLDDVILVPLGVALAVRMIPKTVLEECREKAGRIMKEGTPQSRTAAAVIIVIWVLLLLLGVLLVGRLIRAA